MNLFPGSKDWIQKYFHLIDTELINIHRPKDGLESCPSDLHLLFIRHGILFGHSNTPIFFRASNEKKWTNEEQVKYLLFESLLFIYIRSKNSFNQAEFIQVCLDFYNQIAEEENSFLKLEFLGSKSTTEKLENIFQERIAIKSRLISTNKWIKYIENSFIFLDVILFEYFLEHNKKIVPADVEKLKYNTLLTIIQASHSDKSVSRLEKTIFKTFLNASGLPSNQKTQLKNKFKTNARFTDYYDEYFHTELTRFFLLDIAIFTIQTNEQVDASEIAFLNEFADALNISTDQFTNANVAVQQFILNNQDFIPALTTDKSYEKMLNNLSNRWIKILSRNKDKFVTELLESKELLALLTKATTTELSKEEKKKVKEQFKDLVKSMPSLAVFMLPGGAILLPLLLKVIPNLLPSSFRDNEIK